MYTEIRKISAQGTETPKQMLTLKIGINKIGRRSDETQLPSNDEILINTQDSSIHRQYHCIIEVTAKNKGFDYILSPFESASNPTCLGPERSPLHRLDAIYLKENVPFYIGQDTMIDLVK